MKPDDIRMLLTCGGAAVILILAFALGVAAR